MDFTLGLLPHAYLYLKVCDVNDDEDLGAVDLKSALYFGEGVTEDEWLGLLCVCSEASFGNSMAIHLLGDLAFRSFTDIPERADRLYGASRVFPGLAMVMKYMEDYVKSFENGSS